MTREEAEKIARVIGFADSARERAVRDIAEDLNAMGFGFVFEVTGDTVTDTEPRWGDRDDMETTRLVVTVREAGT